MIRLLLLYFVFKAATAPLTFLVGALLGLLPDLNSLFVLLFGKWTPGVQMLSHHRHIWHTPIFSIFIAAIIGLVVE